MKKYLCAIAALVCLATTAVAQSEFSFLCSTTARSLL